MIVDKGTLDALMCDSNEGLNAYGEADRVEQGQEPGHTGGSDDCPKDQVRHTGANNRQVL